MLNLLSAESAYVARCNDIQFGTLFVTFVLWKGELDLTFRRFVWKYLVNFGRLTFVDARCERGCDLLVLAAPCLDA